MPKVSRRVIAEVLARQSLGSVDAAALSERIAAYLLDNRRTADLQSLLRDIMRCRAEHGIVEVVAVTARPLDTSVRADIEAQVRALYPGAQSIIISETIQTDLVGGIRLEFPDRQLDLSVRGRLSRFKQLTTART